MHPHQIVKHVLAKFQGLPAKMSRLFGKSEEWWRSHGRTPQHLDEYGTGNISPAEMFISFAERYEAAAPGAGQLLNDMVYAELRFRFAHSTKQPRRQNCIRRGLTKEASELVMALDEKEIREATVDDLRRWDIEASELISETYSAQEFIRQEICVRASRGN